MIHRVLTVIKAGKFITACFMSRLRIFLFATSNESVNRLSLIKITHIASELRQNASKVINHVEISRRTFIKIVWSTKSC